MSPCTEVGGIRGAVNRYGLQPAVGDSRAGEQQREPSDSHLSKGSRFRDAEAVMYAGDAAIYTYQLREQSVSNRAYILLLQWGDILGLYYSHVDQPSKRSDLLSYFYLNVVRKSRI
jgi:hypothetical protein